jgi:hypothetical protein
MTYTFDVFRGQTGDLHLLCSGMGNAPTITNLGAGDSVTLGPALVSGIGALSIVAAPPHMANSWLGTLPSDSAATEARLEIQVGDEIHRATVRWPEPAPAPAPKPVRR